MRKTDGFTLIEVMISLIIITFVMITIFSSFNLYHSTTTLAMRNALTLKDLRFSLNMMKQDLLEGRGLYNNDINTIPATHPDDGFGSTYFFYEAANVPASNKADELVIILPSIDASGKFIDIADLEKIDYIRYYRNPLTDTVIRKIYPSNVSSRVAGTKIIGRNITGIKFESLDRDNLSDETYHTLDTLSDSARSKSINVRVTVKGDIQHTVGEVPIEKILTLNVFFRNAIYKT